MTIINCDDCKEYDKGVQQLQSQIAQLQAELKTAELISKQELHQDLTAALAELEQYRWIPVSERLPGLFDIPCPHSKRVLIDVEEDLSEMMGGVSIGYYSKEKGWRTDYDMAKLKVIRWMYLPALTPPKQNLDPARMPTLKSLSANCEVCHPDCPHRKQCWAIGKLYTHDEVQELTSNDHCSEFKPKGS